MTTYIFAGPSLSEDLRSSLSEYAVLLPPVAGGDLLKLKTKAGDTVGIIDGYFARVPSVRHKEILHLLDAGVIVHGASSMGALRAAELADFGMVGHGRIFRDYYRGLITADDEVAILHGTKSENYESYTVPLVNVRYALQDAAALGEMEPDVARVALLSGGRLPYAHRTISQLVSAARESGLNSQECEVYRKIVKNALNVKQEDAIELLEALKGANGAPSRQQHGWQLHDSLFLNEWRESSTGESDEELGFIPDRNIHEACRLFAADYASFRESVANSFLSAGLSMSDNGCEERSREQVKENALRQLRKMHILAPCDRDCATPLDMWCTASEMSLHYEERALKAASRVLFSDTRPGVTSLFVAELRKRGTAFEAARAVVRANMRFNRELEAKYARVPHHSQLNGGKIISWYTQRWEVDDFEGEVLRRGFQSIDDFLSCARRYYLYDKAGRGRVTLSLCTLSVW
ncbi:TfuA-like protein [Streptomyces sp. NPDC001139]